MRIFLFLFAFWGGGFFPLYGEEGVKSTESETEEQVPQKVDGIFEVVSIRNETGYFVVMFRGAEEKTKDKRFFLEVNHLSIGLEVKKKIELSAELLPVKGKGPAEALQVFVNQVEGKGRVIKVWLLSRKEKGLNLRGTSYLKMHNASDDFLIL